VVGTIIDTARDDYDVIVMATHGRTGFAKVLMGSVAESVLHKAPCPVLLVPVHPAHKA
jgi:nucleotide-binding universal stress UspA family protein